MVVVILASLQYSMPMLLPERRMVSLCCLCTYNPMTGLRTMTAYPSTSFGAAVDLRRHRQTLHIGGTMLTRGTTGRVRLVTTVQLRIALLWEPQAQRGPMMNSATVLMYKALSGITDTAIFSSRGPTKPTIDSQVRVTSGRIKPDVVA